MGIFIPHEALSNLKNYKYQSDDRSLVTKYVLKPFWLKFVKIFPLSMAPNAVTLSGLGFVIVNLITTLYYDPYLDTPSPRWTYFTYAFGLFMYQTFDACDGAHARRTGQSGPLGELFDHCVDAVNTTLCLIVFGSVTQTGCGFILLLSQFGTLANFYLSTWEEYHTHVLYLSEISGPVEGILIIIAMHLATGIFGSTIWTTPLFQLDLGWLTQGNVGFTATHAYTFIGAAGLYFNIHSARRNVNNAFKNNKAKLNEATKGLIPFFAYYTSIVVLLVTNPAILDNTIPLVISIGLTIAFSVGRIITAHLTIQAFPMINPPMFIPTVQLISIPVLTHVFGYDYQKVLTALGWGGLGLTVGIHSMFVTEIIYEITTYLDIYALTIKHPKTA
ncbi:hypothetical protein BABINDRAFT_158949 [Babjeviella inositovora NRRL Y-12698]|uniref:diacylglycerol cholinephosphotransferase n=1 Tax=Babjeviella inositovora NRRL Y-12698 TaxID=984486 RepID=A0A1E3QXD1_9ASCO|nr:uncharacterized protein BABINDRAFT_158949 [Babjeviella inositovora NRRL Y-12698]ODQ82330.1 hypothetical protein BABINDRAFT_158949 [Babjeviella inositovora NRRL Y-12698]